MYPTKYHKPGSIPDAVALLAGSDAAKVLSGGQTLLPTMKQHLAAPSDLVDVRSIAELNGICMDDGAVVIGAATRHADVATNADVRAHIPALAALAGGIGDPAVRAMGTIGGSLANNDPAADYPAAVLGLGATVVTDRREIGADDFFQGMFTTALEADEIVTAVRFPVPACSAYAKFENPASKYAVVGVFVARTGGGVRVAVTGAGPGVFRAAAMEEALAADFSAGALEGVSIDPADLMSDDAGSAEYRAHLTGVMARRAVEACS